MSYTRDTLIRNSQELMRDNLNHTFFAVTIRPHIKFMKRFSQFPSNTRQLVGEAIIQNLIIKYDSHLISKPNKPQNHHLKIIHHNAVEQKHKNGSYDIPHSHGIWGIHNSFLDKWNDEGFHARIKELGSFHYEDKSYPLSNVIHSVWKTPFHSSLVAETYPEGWLSYCYKWCDDKDTGSSWSIIHSGGWD